MIYFKCLVYFRKLQKFSCGLLANPIAIYFLTIFLWDTLAPINIVEVIN